MITCVYPNIYQIQVPLPETPLKTVHAYFIRGDQRNLLVDSGFRCPQSHQAIREACQELSFDFHSTDLFLTHCHSDHCGLTSTLITPETQVYASKETAQSISGEDKRGWPHYQKIAVQSGLPLPEITDHVGFHYSTEPIHQFMLCKEGDVIQVGDFSWQVLDTTGHAPGHLCLYEPKLKILFSGDHILDQITPNNTVWDLPWRIQQDLLQCYLDNLEKIDQLEVQLTLSSHRGLLGCCKSRIQELRDHHYGRLTSILGILQKKSPLNGAEIASQMEWSMRGKTWEEFPPGQKLFATGEAMSHLVHLEFQGKVRSTLEDGVVYYQLCPSPSEKAPS